MKKYVVMRYAGYPNKLGPMRHKEFNSLDEANNYLENAKFDNYYYDIVIEDEE